MACGMLSHFLSAGKGTLLAGQELVEDGHTLPFSYDQCDKHYNRIAIPSVHAGYLQDVKLTNRAAASATVKKLVYPRSSEKFIHILCLKLVEHMADD